MALTGRLRLLTKEGFPERLLIHEYFVAGKNLDIEFCIFVLRLLAVYDVSLSVLPG